MDNNTAIIAFTTLVLASIILPLIIVAGWHIIIRKMMEQHAEMMRKYDEIEKKVDRWGKRNESVSGE